MFKEEFETLSPKEEMILLGKGKHTPSEIARYNNDKLGNTGRFLIYLEEKGVISKEGKGNYVMDDPVLEKWLKTRI